MGSSMYAYVTLVTSDSYAAGALVLGHQLKDNGTPHDLVCLVTNNVSPTVVHQLQSLFTIVPVETLVSQDIAHLNLLGRPDLIHTFTKCHVWRLETYQKLVFLDADTLPLGNVDELFDRPHFSAAPDAGWPDCFNSGMFVTCPSKTTYDALLSLANQEGSFDGGDQGLLNRYFDQWHRLPFTYNTTPTSQYSYAPAHQFYQHNISICHFIGLNKPWKYQRFDDGKVLSHEWDGLTQLLQAWWDTWQKHYGELSPHQLLSTASDGPIPSLPVKAYPGKLDNAWDTHDFEHDMQRYQHHRHVQPMPPIGSISISTPTWFDQDDAESVDSSTLASEGVLDTPQDQPLHTSTPNAPTLCEGQHASDQPHHEPAQDYAMIEWNPAREPPPTTGMATHFPNLTLHYGNVWDQPLHEHPVWIPPSLPATRVPAAPDNPPPQPHPAEHTASPSSPLLQYHLHHPHRLHNHHQHNEHQPESQYQQHSVADPTTPAEPLPAPPAPTFPWEHRSAPEPTRIWLEDQTQRTPHIKAQEHSTDDQNQEDTRPRYDVPVCDPPESQNASNDLPGGIPDSSSDHGSHTLDTVLTKVNPAPINTVSDQASDPPLELQPASKTPPATPTSQYAIDTISPALLSRSSSKLTLDEEHSPDDWSDRDLIPINLKSSSKLHLGSPMSPRSPFSMSRRNSMPSILATSRRGSVSSLRSWTNHGSPAFGPVSAGPVSATGAQPVTRPLFATTSMFASAYKQTPYTSAAATPTAERSFYFDDQPEEWTAEPLDIDDDDGLDANSVDEDNPVPQLSLLSLDYSLDLALREASNSAHHYGFQHQSHPSYMYRFPYPPYNHHRRDSSSASSVSSTSSSSIPNLPLTRSWSSHPHPQPQASTSSPLLSTTATRSYPGSGASSPGANTPTRSRRFARKASWDPAAALENLKRQTENIITSGPPSRHAIPLADIATPVSSLPHAHSPAPSVSPTTPTMHALRDNLTLEIAAAKDSYRQEQRMAHHIMMQPTMAIGTHLEVELDMSKSALLHRRHPAASTSAAAGNIAIHAPIASALSTFPDSPRATPSLTQDEHNDDLTTSEDADSPESVLKQVDGQLLPQNGQPANVVPEQDDLPLPPSEPSPQLLQHKEESDPQHRIEAPVTSMDPEAFVFPMLEQPELPAAGPSLGSPSTSSSSTFFFDPSAVAIAKQRLAELVSPLEQEDVEVTSPSSATLQCLSQYSFPSDALIYASPQLWPPHRQASVSSPSALGSYGVTSTPPSLSTKETAAQIPDIASSLTGDDPHPSNQTENTDPDEENSSNQQHVMVIDHVSLISSVSSMTSLPSAGTTDQEMDDQDDNDDDDNDSMMYLSAVDSTLVSESDASDWHTVGTATPIGLRSPLIFDAEIARRPALLGAMVQLLENDDADDEELSISSDHTATGLT